MRTRTNLYFGQGIDGGIRAVKNLYPGGLIVVVAEDGDEGAYYAEELTEAGYRVDVREVEKTDPAECFCLGVGGERAIQVTREIARGKYAFFPTVLLPELFLPNGRGVLAEFVYYDADCFTPDDPGCAAECYAGLFCALTQGLARAYADAGFPYRDGTLLTEIGRAKDILLGKSDREYFLTECASTTKTLCEALTARGIRYNVASEMARRLGGGAGNRDLTAYFLNRLLILFTKWNFRDMLIPSEKASFSTAYDVEDLLLTEKDVAKMARWVRRDVYKPNFYELVAAMKSAVEGKNDLFAEIYARGLPEGLRYG